MFQINKCGRPSSWCKKCVAEASRLSAAKKRQKLRAREFIEIPIEKKCCRCKQVKPSASFGLSSQVEDGLRSYCKPCEVDWAIKKYEQNVELNRKIAMDKYYKDQKNKQRIGRVAAAVRRSRIIGGGGRHNRSDIERIFKLQKGQCANCLCSVANGYHIDHIIPVSKGGSSWPTNLQILCPHCNMKKRDRDPYDHAKTLGRLF